MGGPSCRKQMFPLGPESGKQPGLRLQGKPPLHGGGCWGSRWGRKMAADRGGACAITSSTIPTHTLAFGQNQGLKIATTGYSAISRALFPREPAVPWPRSGGSRDAESVPGCREAVSHGGCAARWGEPGQGGSGHRSFSASRQEGLASSCGCFAALAQTYCQLEAWVGWLCPPAHPEVSPEWISGLHMLNEVTVIPDVAVWVHLYSGCIWLSDHLSTCVCVCVCVCVCESRCVEREYKCECGIRGGEEQVPRPLPRGPAAGPHPHLMLRPLPPVGPPHKARGFSIQPPASASLRMSSWSGTTVSIKVF